MKILLNTSIVLVSALLLAACGDSEKEWPQADQDSFTENCVPEAAEAETIDAEAYCDCMLHKVMDKYPDPEDAEELGIGEMFEMAQDCSEQAGY